MKNWLKRELHAFFALPGKDAFWNRYTLAEWFVPGLRAWREKI